MRFFRTWVHAGCAVVTAGMLCAAAIAADAEDATRIRGTVVSFDGKALTVKIRAEKMASVLVADSTEIVFTKPVVIADIKPGDFLGVTSKKNADGSLTAVAVQRFLKPLDPGHRPLDGHADQIMTNATVSSVVEKGKGRELTLSYEGATQKIWVPESASVSIEVPAERAQIVPGVVVELTAVAGHDGQLVARRIQVSKPQPASA